MRESIGRRDRSAVQLDRPQMVWLALGVVVCLGVAFALGFVTGRRAERIGATPVPTDPIAQIESDKAIHDELTFYSKLTQDQKTANRRAQEPGMQQPSAAQTSAAQPPANRNVGLPPPPIGHDSTAAAPAATKAKGPQEQHRLAQAVARARKDAKRRKARATPPPSQPKVDRAAVRAALDRGPAESGEYTVQVSAFQSLGEANAFASGLERKGYKPFVVTSTIAERGTWYRVRVGRFLDKDAAETAKGLLAQAAIPSWVLRTE